MLAQSSRRALALVVVAAASGGCNALLGLEDGILKDADCEPRAVVACYDGPEPTRGVGACRAGQASCSASGDGYGSCEGEVLPTKERCGNGIDDDCDGAIDEGCELRDPPDDALAGQLLGGPGDQRALALTAAGHGFAVGGTFEGALDLGAASGPILESGASRDVFVARFDPSGVATQATRLVESGSGLLRAMASDGMGRLAIAVELSGTVPSLGIDATGDLRGFLVTLDERGEFGPWWPLPGLPRGMAMTAAGDLAVASTVDDATLAREIAVNVYPASVVGLDVSLQLGGAGDQEPAGIAFDADGDLVLTGTFEGDLGFGEGTPSLTANERDLFVARIDRHGNLRHAVAFGGTGDQRGGDVKVGPHGEIAISGAFSELIDLGRRRLFADDGCAVFVAELGPDLEPRFSLSFPGETPPRLAFTDDGGLLFAGEVEGTIELAGEVLSGARGGIDVVAAELDSQGAIRWSRRFGPGAGARGGVRRAAGIAVGAEAGDVWLAGSADGSVDFGAGPVPSSASDAMLVQRAP